MELIISRQPSVIAGEHLSNWIAAEAGPVLCLLSGGSALDVIPHLKLTPDSKVRTIFVMGDERWSREPTINNFLQLKECYPNFVTEHTVIDTSAREGEEHGAYADRINAEIQQLFSTRENVRTIALLGIGSDGHTAGIFPMEESAFVRTYSHNRFYSLVAVDNAVCGYRASVTPSWIAAQVAEIILYATGSSKRAILASLLSQNEPIHRMPAQFIKTHPDSVLVTDQVIE